MKATFKRFLSLALVLMMVLSYVPASAFAEEGVEQPPECGHENAAVETVEPTCGAPGSVTITCECGYSNMETLEATGEHTYDAGACTLCGAEDPDYVPDEGQNQDDALQGASLEGGDQEPVYVAPQATVTVLDPITLAAGNYITWPSGANDVDRPLQVVMNFQAQDTLEDCLASGYSNWLCDFYLTFSGLENGSVTAEGCYLAGNYGDIGWVVIPTDGLVVENSVQYPVVSQYDASLNYKDICSSVQNFTAALYITPEILAANPNFKVSLELKMTDPENSDNVYEVGEPAVYDVSQLMGKPQATVSVLDPMTLTAGNYITWPSGATDIERPLQAVINFKAEDTLEQATASGYGKWNCDFYLTFSGLEKGSVVADGCYLAGNYGEFGWVVIPTDELEVEEGVEYSVVSAYDANLTYEDICKSVKNFTAALYIAPEILAANPNFKVSLELKMTDPENPDNVYRVGKPAVYDIPKLVGTQPPKAEVTVLDPMTLTAAEHNYMVWPSGDDTIDRPLQVVMNFKSQDTPAEAKIGGYSDWICDFYLEFEGLKDGSVVAEDCYLAGNYGEFGWVVIPTDELEVENDVQYPVVSAYDAKLTYQQICESVKDFTAALYISPKIIRANPDFKVSLTLKMRDPDNAENVLQIGDAAVYEAEDLAGKLPKATVTKMDPITLVPETHEQNVWTGSLSKDTQNRPLQAVMNFKAEDTLDECLAGGYSKWLVDFYLTFKGLPEEGLTAEDCYLAGNYGDFGWIVIPTDTLTVENGMEYPVVSAYDATLNYKDICGSVKDFTAALYVAPEILTANPDFQVELTLKMTNPEDEDDVLQIGETAVYTADQLLRSFPPKATVTKMDPITLTAAEHNYMTWPSGDNTIDRPLQVVMNFKAEDTLDECLAGGYSEWLVDFYLTFDGLTNGSVKAEDCYLAGNYGPFGWIVIPTDTLIVENGEEYPVVSNYDATLNYKDICKSVKDFTAALYIAPEILKANPDISVTLELRMINPEDENDVITIGEKAEYTLEDLLAYTDIVAQNVQTGKVYSTVNAATMEAKSGETVILLTDAEESMLFVTESVTLNLNGHKLTADYATSFGNVVDKDEAKGGTLAVSKDHLMIQQNNEMLPIRTAEGYKFVAVTKVPVAFNDKGKFAFQVRFEPAAKALLVANGAYIGAEATGVQFLANVSWEQENGKRNQDFTYNDAFVSEYLNGWNAEAGKYKKMFTLSLTGADGLENMTYAAAIKSETGVRISATME